MTIISASYKTDIPAFYGAWFENRLKEGFVQIRNPFNSKLSTVSLMPEDIDGFVFWTRNIGPFLPRLEKLIARQYPFYIQFTLTGYPRLLENSVPDTEVALSQMKGLADQYGPSSIVWRYDPILMSSLTPAEFHLDNFTHLSHRLSGFTDEVVVSFAQFYQKTKRNLHKLTETADLSFEDPEPEIKQRILLQLAAIAKSNGQALTLCTQPHRESKDISGAECISARRLGVHKSVKMHGNRKGCLCRFSKDIGGYDTCPHGCAYCYAVANTTAAKAAFKTHQPTSAILQ